MMKQIVLKKKEEIKLKEYCGKFMISDRLKELIKPQLMLHLDHKDWVYIDDMFTEAYVTTFQGVERVTLKPHPEAGTIAMQFMTLNGTFIDLTDWNYIKTKGTKL